MSLHEKNGLSWFEFEVFAPYKQYLSHACFTRKGGVSNVPYDSLNTGLSVGDAHEHVQENRRRIASHFNGTEDLLFSVEQVHGLDFFIAENTPPQERKGDILLTKTAQNILMIKHADCQAAILYDPIHHAVATVHAGWRGQVQKAYTKALDLMQRLWNTKTSDVLVGVSPSLGILHSEFLSWKEQFPEELWSFCHKNHMDLKAIALYELLKAGVQEKNIEISPCCTFEQEELFFSYRRDHVTGRLATCVQLLSKPKRSLA